jgi:hypothetical protein
MQIWYAVRDSPDAGNEPVITHCKNVKEDEKNPTRVLGTYIQNIKSSWGQFQ